MPIRPLSHSSGNVVERPGLIGPGNFDHCSPDRLTERTRTLSLAPDSSLPGTDNVAVRRPDVGCGGRVLRNGRS